MTVPDASVMRPSGRTISLLVSALAPEAVTASRSEHVGLVVQPFATVVSAVVLTLNVAA